MRIGALQAAKLKVSRLNATIRLAGGRLDVAPLSLGLYEGTASGRIALDANGNRTVHGFCRRNQIARFRIHP